MNEKAVDPFDSNYNLTYLINKKTSQTIRSLKPFEKNIELKVIVIDRKESFITKNKVAITSYIVGDQSGSIYANFYSKNGSFIVRKIIGEMIKSGDILYINGAYTSLFKNQMILYEGSLFILSSIIIRNIGKKGIILKIGEFFFNFCEEPNVSLLDWSSYQNQSSMNE